MITYIDPTSTLAFRISTVTHNSDLHKEAPHEVRREGWDVETSRFVIQSRTFHRERSVAIEHSVRMQKLIEAFYPQMRRKEVRL